jgi:hypothetical protein
MKIRIDYHFHPNLSRNKQKAIKKCKKIWKKFQKKEINCVIITEHSYKNPKRAYDLMIKEKPKNCFCFPGVEYITKEGIDIIIFSLGKKIYDYKELKSFKTTYFDLIDFVKSKTNLFAFVTHPYTLGLTSVINKLGTKDYKKSLNMLNAIEISNGAFDNLYFFMNTFPFKYFFKTKIKKIIKTKSLPKSDYPKKIKFLSAGSDAHHVEEIGNCYEILYPKKINKNKMFKIISNNLGNGKVFYDTAKKQSVSLLLRMSFTTLCEYITKIIIKIKLQKH